MSAATNNPDSNKSVNANAPLLKTKSDEPSHEFDVDRQIEIRATAELERHPHFHGRSQWVQCRCSHRILRLDGCLPSYYLKQLAQSALRDLTGIDRIENQIVVVNPGGAVGPEEEVSQEKNLPRKRDPPLNKPR